MGGSSNSPALPHSWKLSTIGDLCDDGDGAVQTGPFGSQLHASDYVEAGVPSIMPRDIRNDRVSTEEIARVRPSDVERLSKHKVEFGDIVYSRRGDVERRALITQREEGWLCGTGCLRVRLRNAQVSDKYFYYQLGSPDSRSYILRHAHGATMLNLNTSILRSVPVVLPPLPEQKRIAAILGALDDKIELNRQMNQTLEAMAQALFKSWFIDFDGVPESELVESELGLIPRGWKTPSLYSMASFINGAAYRKFQASEDEDEDGLPIIKIAELKSGISASTKRTNSILPEKYRVANRDILFSWSGNPDTSIDTFIWTNGVGWLNQHIFRVQPRNETEYYFLYYLLKYLRPIFAEIARDKQTTGLGHVTARDLKRMKVSFPPKDVLNAFNSLAKPIFERWYGSLLQSQTLADLRDTLLPKLISGELRVGEAEDAVSEVL